jgi:uncharacterized membrane protein
MMDGEMGSMMGWMMGFGLLGWVVVIALLVAIVVLLVRLVNRTGPDDRGRGAPPSGGPALRQ